MDTAQRGMGLGWAEAQELIRRAQAEARTRPDALIAYGAGTDHLAPGPDVTIDDVIRAYEEQVGFVEGAGRPHHPDGLAARSPSPRSRPTTTPASTAASSAR